jgi:hypothetical protein
MKTNKIIKIFVISLFIISFAIAPLQTTGHKKLTDTVEQYILTLKRQLLSIPHLQIMSQAQEKRFTVIPLLTKSIIPSSKTIIYSPDSMTWAVR